MSSRMTVRGGLTLGEEAYELVQASPRRAAALAEKALAAARANADRTDEVSALHALAWAQFELGDAGAEATVRAGIRVAERSGDRRGAGLLRRRLAFMHILGGRPRAAEREIAAALDLLDGPDLARSQVFRVEIHRKAHRADPAADRELLADAADAMSLLHRQGDGIWEARLAYNRGQLWLDRGELDAAEADFRRARALYVSLAADDAAADAALALAEVSRQRGDLVGCLRLLEETEAALPPGNLGVNVSACRLAALMQARLLPEARARGEALTVLAARIGRGDLALRTTLDLAAIATMAGDRASAQRLATTAERSFAARRQPVNAALARAVALRARLEAGNVQRSSVRSALDTAAVLERAGWRRDALRARVLAARLDLALGSCATARRELALAQPLALRGTLDDRVELRHAQGLLRLADGDRSGAERLLAAGLRLLEDYRAALGAEELRATVSGIAAGLAVDGIGIALGSGRPAKVLAWAERMRANTLRLPPVSPAADPKLRALQAELRRVADLARAAEESGRLARGHAGRRAELEAAILARTRLTAGDGASHMTLPRRDAAARLLGGRVLVEYVENRGALAALTLAHGRLALHWLDMGTAADDLEWLRFGLGRLARGTDSQAEHAAALASVEDAAAALDRRLVEPLLAVLGESRLVVIPTGWLHRLPWGSLPSLRGRPVVVAPSLATWLDLAGALRSRRRKIALVAGPRLRHSAPEVRSLAALHPDAVVLHGKAATAKATLAALDGAALAHLACHGTFRFDSPLFSSFELADGPLNVYELQRLRRAPEVVVLSACDLAVSSLRPGDELLGLAAALLGMGTRSIIASVVPVPDAGARTLMLDLHRRFAAGEDLGAALAGAQMRRPESGFVCLGTG